MVAPGKKGSMERGGVLDQDGLEGARRKPRPGGVADKLDIGKRTI
jgi:hypothetical protein